MLPGGAPMAFGRQRPDRLSTIRCTKHGKEGLRRGTSLRSPSGPKQTRAQSLVESLGGTSALGPHTILGGKAAKLA